MEHCTITTPGRPRVALPGLSPREASPRSQRARGCVRVARRGTARRHAAVAGWDWARKGIPGRGEGKGQPALPAGRLALRHYKTGAKARITQFCRPVSLFFPSSSSETPRYIRSERKEMASNYVDTTGDEGRFHGHHSTNTTPTGAAASSPRTIRRSFSNASSGSQGGGGGAKCVCAPPTHAGSFKCRLHRTNSQGHGHGHGHPHPSPPTSPAAGGAAAPRPSSASSRTVEAQ
uniref:Uncharacterized protein n=1 Tax=Oryza meridionalis TaxID=40149 RepID=A0A0E0CLC8_9ORYZ